MLMLIGYLLISVGLFGAYIYWYIFKSDEDERFEGAFAAGFCIVWPISILGFLIVAVIFVFVHEISEKAHKIREKRFKTREIPNRIGPFDFGGHKNVD